MADLSNINVEKLVAWEEEEDFWNISGENYRIETMFGSSLPTVVCRMAHVLVFNTYLLYEYHDKCLIRGMSSPPMLLVGSVLFMFFSFLCCVFVSFVFVHSLLSLWFSTASVM